MIKRNILQYLREWAKKHRRKPLVIRGARQVGKTTVVKEFAREFDGFIMLNMEKSQDKEYFDKSDAAKDILEVLLLTRLPEVSDLSSKRILLFIDEIQAQPKAVGMLRYFYEEIPALFVIAAGSRLQELFKTGVSFPVGRVEYVNMRPCFFDEFLDGIGYRDLKPILCETEISTLMHEQLMSIYNTYALIGGMPEIISEYSDTGSLTTLSPLYQGLLQSYDEDVENYAGSRQQVSVLRHILRTGWNKAGQSIIFSKFGDSSYTSTAVHKAFELLERAFLLNLDYPTTGVKIPIESTSSRSPKLIWVDTGLVNYSAGIQVEYLQNKSLADVWRGHAAEQIVGQELWQVLDRNFQEEEMYWVRDKKGANAEVDFVMQMEGLVIPIEVKSGTNAHLRSLQSFTAQQCAGDVAVRVWPGEFSVDEVKNSISGTTFRLINIPFYKIGQLDTILRTTL